jgi:hypothetical protein
MEYKFTVMGKLIDQCELDILKEEVEIYLSNGQSECSGFDELRIKAIREEIDKREKSLDV